MRPRTAVSSVVAIGLLTAAAWGAWSVWSGTPARTGKGDAKSDKPLVVTSVAQRRDLLITVDETGSLAAKETTPVSPETGGTLLWVCENGGLVSKDDLLATVDPTQAEQRIQDLVRQLDDAQRKLDQAKRQAEADGSGAEIRLQRTRDSAAAEERKQQATLRDLQDSLDFKEAELTHQRSDLETTRRLAQKGLIAGIEVESAEAGLKSAEFGLKSDRTEFGLKKAQADAAILTQRKQVDQAEQDLAAQKRRSDGNIRVAQNEVESLQLRLKKARDDLAKTAIKAPADGLVVLAEAGWRGESHPYRAGDRISSGNQLAQIVNLRQMQVKLELDQPRIIGLKVGQQVLVDLDALPGRTFSGKVVEIGKTARRPPVEGMRWMNSSDMTFPVTVDLPPTKHATMRPGMRANARIITRRIRGAIVVPADSVFRRGGHSIIYVERAGQYRRVAVTTGASSGDYTAITRGIKLGERVALNDLASVAAEDAPQQEPPL